MRNVFPPSNALPCRALLYPKSIPRHATPILVNHVSAVLLRIVRLREQHTVVSAGLFVFAYAAWLEVESVLRLTGSAQDARCDHNAVPLLSLSLHLPASFPRRGWREARELDFVASQQVSSGLSSRWAMYIPGAVSTTGADNHEPNRPIVVVSREAIEVAHTW
jgi:hypothetical protein